MKKVHIRKDLIFLTLILLVLFATGGILLYTMQIDPIEAETSSDNLLKVLVVLEKDGVPFSSNAIICYQETKRTAMFDIPANTGLILQSLGRTDGIAATYTEKGVAEYKKEVEKLIGIDIPFYITCSLDEFSQLTDMLSGLMIFISTPVDIDDEENGRVLLPSGAATLDGDKIRSYLTYSQESDNEGEAVGRKQKAVLAFFRAIHDHKDEVLSTPQGDMFAAQLHSNLGNKELQKLLLELSQLDSERLVPQRLTGLNRVVDGKELIFPFRDGKQAKEILKQTIAALVSEGGTTMERVYALEILNGTDIRGLAKKTSETYQSFGYDVITVGNSEKEAEKTLLIDRIGNPAAAKIVGQVIHCENIKPVEDIKGSHGELESGVDFTLILGADFNGYYVIKKE